MAHLGERAAAGVGHQAVRQVVLVVILGAGRIDFGDQRGARINILPRRAGAIVVFGDDLGAGEDVHGGRGISANQRHFFDAQAVAVIRVGAGVAAVGGADGVILSVVNERVVPIVRHVAAEIIGIGRASDVVRGGVHADGIGRAARATITLDRTLS